MKHNILITSAGKRVALVRAFKETLVEYFPEAKVYTTDMNPDMAPAGYVSDGCFKVPRVTSDNYIQELMHICIERGVGIVVPTIDTELMVLARCKSQFADCGITLMVSDEDFVAKCRDKRETGELFEDHAVRVPRLIDIENPAFPIFAKPYDGSLSKDLYVIKDMGGLTDEIRNNPKLIYMEYVDTSIYKEFTVDMYYGRDNLVKSIVPRERIEIRAGEINKGVTRKGVLVDYLKTRLFHLPGVVGCICVQLFYNEVTGDVIGIEINPRFGGGYPLTYASGANYPKLLIEEYLCDKPVVYDETWQDGKLMLRYDDAVFV